MKTTESDRRRIDKALEETACRDCNGHRTMITWISKDIRDRARRAARQPDNGAVVQELEKAKEDLAQRYVSATEHLQGHVQREAVQAANWRDREWCKKCGEHRTQNANKVCRHCGPNVRHVRNCTQCGMPTQSTTGLCAEHRPTGQGQRGPCVECGAQTSTADRVCRRCKDLQAAGGKPKEDANESLCADCGIEAKSKDKDRCRGCEEAIKDDNNTRGLQESHFDLQWHGEWRLDPVRRIQVWVPTPDLAAQRDEVTIKRQANVMAEKFTQLPGLDPDATPECEHVGCFNRFVPSNKRHRYCSESCKDKAYYQRKKGQAA